MGKREVGGEGGRRKKSHRWWCFGFGWKACAHAGPLRGKKKWSRGFSRRSPSLWIAAGLWGGPARDVPELSHGSQPRPSGVRGGRWLHAQRGRSVPGLCAHHEGHLHAPQPALPAERRLFPARQPRPLQPLHLDSTRSRERRLQPWIFSPSRVTSVLLLHQHPHPGHLFPGSGGGLQQLLEPFC